MSTYKQQAGQLLGRIQELGTLCAVYYTEGHDLRVRSVWTRRGLESAVVGAALDRGALLGVYDARCKQRWLAEDLRAEAEDTP